MFQYQCPKCGGAFATNELVSRVRCPYCGEEFQTVLAQSQSGFQPQSGDSQQYAYNHAAQSGVFDVGPSGKSRGVAGLLAILLKGLGVHYFYLGKVGAGFLCILLSLVTCGVWNIVMLIQGILMLTMSQEDFERKYVNNTSVFPLF